MQSKFCSQHMFSLLGTNWQQNLQPVQALWAGFGHVYKAQREASFFVIKHYCWKDKIVASEEDSFALQRKIASFKNELLWYKNVLKINEFQTAKSYLAEVSDQEMLLVLEDLTQADYHCGNREITTTEIDVTLKALAFFHAAQVQVKASQLGGYWHLETRPFELGKMEPSWFKENASQLHEILKNASFKTILHGDAKPANYGFRVADSTIAAFDFQYWGSGIGVQDVVCYLSGLLSKKQDWEYCTARYFAYLQSALQTQKFTETQALIAEWKGLLPIAWADYMRFLLGWNPNHFKAENGFDLYQREAQKLLR